MEALTLKEKFYGKDSPEVAKTLMSLANMYGKLKDLKKKKIFLERCYDIYQRFFSDQYHPEHYRIAYVLENLGNTHGELKGDPFYQVELLEEALHSNQQKFGNTHSTTALTLYNLSNAYQAIENFSKANQALSQAYAICHDVYGQQHPKTIMIKEALDNMKVMH